MDSSKMNVNYLVLDITSKIKIHKALERFQSSSKRLVSLYCVSYIATRDSLMCKLGFSLSIFGIFYVDTLTETAEQISLSPILSFFKSSPKIYLSANWNIF